MNSRTGKAIRTLAFIALAFYLSIVQPLRAQTWTTDADLKVARWNHTATLLTNGLVLIAGGEIFNDSSNGFFRGTNCAELYNPVTGSSAFTTSMHDAHWVGTATLLNNGSVLVAGGRDNFGSVLTTSELYSPASGTWTTSSMKHQHSSFSAVLLANGQVMAVAGQDNSAVDQPSAEIYDPVSGVWTNTAPLPYATDSGAAILLPNGKVLFCGGNGNLTNAVLYNPATATWTNTGPMIEGRAGHVATLLPNGKVLVVGGGFDGSAELYNPATGSWTAAASMNDGHFNPSAALLPDGQVLVVGGFPGQTDTELYDSTNDVWTYAASMHVGRIFSTETSLGDGEVVVTGGDAGTIGYYNGPAISSVETYGGHAVSINHTLVAHYPFDADPTDNPPYSSEFLQDTSGNGYDINSIGLDGEIYPAITTNSAAGISAVQFDGNNWYELPTNLLTTIAGTYSISLWLQTTQVSGDDDDDGFSDPAILWAGGVGDNTFDSEPMTLTGHKLGFYTGGDETTLHSVSNIDSGNFTFIVVTREQPTGIKKIYINGVLDSTATASTNFLSDSTDLVLGESFYNNGVTGVVDDVQFYQGLLTDSDIARLYANPGSVAPVGVLVTFNATLDDTNLAWTTSGDASWFGETDVSHDGDGAAQSGSLTDEESSTLETTVTGPGLLTFWWKLTNAGDDFSMEFDIDDDAKDSLSSVTDWTEDSFRIDAGQHDLTWVVSTGDGVSPSDAGYLDQVTFVADGTPPSPGVWRLTGSLTNAPTLHTATLLTNGLVLTVGGEDSNDLALASVQLYNPASGTWAGAHSLNHARFSHTATLLTNGMVLVAGGATNASDESSATTSAELYNPATGNWTVTGSLNIPRYSHSATLLPDGRVLVAGGQGTNAYPDIISSAEIYNPNTGLWMATNSMMLPRYNFTATLLTNGQVLVAGGITTNTFLVTGMVELYNPANGTWANIAQMPFPLANHTATLLPNGQVLVAGGDIDEGFGFGIDLVPTALAALYDPNSAQWTATSSMNVAHEIHTATLLPDGLVLIAGFGQSGSVTNSSELYNPASQTWTTAAPMNFARHNHTATLLPNGLVLAVAGQQYFGNTLASAELYSSIILPTITLTNASRSSGVFQFGFTNTPGAGSTVFYTTNLTTPFTNWTSLGGATETSPGLFKFIDSSATNSRRFYRVSSP